MRVLLTIGTAKRFASQRFCSAVGGAVPKEGHADHSHCKSFWSTSEAWQHVHVWRPGGRVGQKQRRTAVISSLCSANTLFLPDF